MCFQHGSSHRLSHKGIYVKEILEHDRSCIQTLLDDGIKLKTI